MKDNFDIDINEYCNILEQIVPFVELEGKLLSYIDIKTDSTFINGGLLGLMGLDIYKYKHLVIVSNNPFLGDNLTLTMPVVKYFKGIEFIEKIDVYLPFSALFKSYEDINFIDYKDYISIQSKLTKKTLVLAFSLIEGELKEMIKSLNSDVLIGLNDKYIKFYNSGKLMRTLNCGFYDSDYFSQDYTEGIRNQLNLNSKYRIKSNFDQSELLVMVKSYLHRTNQNWDNHHYWGKIFNGDFSGANDALYSNVYEYGVWMFKLLFGSNYRWVNFKDLINPKDFQMSKNEILSTSSAPFIFVNINLNTSKLIWQNIECGILDYISAILKHSQENEYKVIFTHPSFDVEVNDTVYDLFTDKNDFASILFPEDIVDWIPFMKSAKAVVSFDTGFVHLAYLYNSNVLSFGGQSFFWHFPNTDYVNTNHIDNSGNVSRVKFNQSLNNVLNWINND
jgi:hypothetical protein